MLPNEDLCNLQAFADYSNVGVSTFEYSECKMLLDYWIDLKPNLVLPRWDLSEVDLFKCIVPGRRTSDEVSSRILNVPPMSTNSTDLWLLHESRLSIKYSIHCSNEVSPAILLRNVTVVRRRYGKTSGFWTLVSSLHCQNAVIRQLTSSFVDEKVALWLLRPSIVPP